MIMVLSVLLVPQPTLLLSIHAPTLHPGSTITSTSGTAFETTSLSDSFARGIEMELTRPSEENAGYKAASMTYSMHISSYI